MALGHESFNGISSGKKFNFIRWNGMIEGLIRSNLDSEDRELSAWIRFGVNTAWYFQF
jgi:hypothetical protein